MCPCCFSLVPDCFCSQALDPFGHGILTAHLAQCCSPAPPTPTPPSHQSLPIRHRWDLHPKPSHAPIASVRPQGGWSWGSCCLPWSDAGCCHPLHTPPEQPFLSSTSLLSFRLMDTLEKTHWLKLSRTYPKNQHVPKTSRGCGRG